MSTTIRAVEPMREALDAAISAAGYTETARTGEGGYLTVTLSETLSETQAVALQQACLAGLVQVGGTRRPHPIGAAVADITVGTVGINAVRAASVDNVQTELNALGAKINVLLASVRTSRAIDT